MALTELIIYRLQSRVVHAKVVAKAGEIRALRRSIAKVKAKGVTAPLAELRIKKLEGEHDAAGYTGLERYGSVSTQVASW